jgi:hypothetical protein
VLDAVAGAELAQRASRFIGVPEQLAQGAGRPLNIAAATCVGPGERAELHILVPHAEAARHALAISHDVTVSHEREVVVVEVEDRPGVLADLTRKIARAGVDLDLVYDATQNRVVFGAPDLAALRAALDAAD